MSSIDLGVILEEMGEVGQRVAAMGASEGGAGNISVFTRNLSDMDDRFAAQGVIDLPVPAPALADGWVIITGTGKRLRDIRRHPERTIGVVRVHRGGQQGTLYAVEAVRPTSEFNSHLAVHEDHVRRRGVEQHSLVHAQPVRLTYLSHLPAYSDTARLTRRLFRWQPETLAVFPEGIGLLPFQPPGSAEQEAVTVRGMAEYRAIVWQRHGILTRSDVSVEHACDLVEYAETAAYYEVINLALGQPTQGLSDADLRLIGERLGLAQKLF
ncbi:MAG: rhamnulose-1-phosphate aldolase [Anaerolineae bacterium]|nr:rhamnulose-1-phosphate aldolase [Anaerolineae bacterium]